MRAASKALRKELCKWHGARLGRQVIVSWELFKSEVVCKNLRWRVADALS